MFFDVYIIYSESHDKYYIGQTNDIVDRIKRHINGLENFTSLYLPWVLKCVIKKLSRSEAMILEKEIKKLK
jgi:putative endonuclease